VGSERERDRERILAREGETEKGYWRLFTMVIRMR
jgi:hypothetical protein